MKMRSLAWAGMGASNARVMATCVAFVVVGCTDEAARHAAHTRAGSAGKAGSSTASGGSSSSGSAAAGGDAGGEAGPSAEAGAPATAGSSGSGGGVGCGGSGGGGGGMSNRFAATTTSTRRRCDDGNKVSGDGCSYDCKKACETCEKDVCPSKRWRPGSRRPLDRRYPKAYGVEASLRKVPRGVLRAFDLLRSSPVRV